MVFIKMAPLIYKSATFIYHLQFTIYHFSFGNAASRQWPYFFTA
ncbi:hypothetical protein [uncultured Dialister sp.]|nr:hypothetical protein [uncultured Dialister sp.]